MKLYKHDQKGERGTHFNNKYHAIISYIYHINGLEVYLPPKI